MKFVTTLAILFAFVCSSTTNADAFSVPSLSSARLKPLNSNNKIHTLSGGYCGNYMANMVSGKVEMHDNQHTFDLTVRAFGNPETGCKSISYALDEKSGAVFVPDAHNPKSCLGDMLASGGLSLDVAFDNKKGVVKLDLGIAKLTLSQC